MCLKRLSQYFFTKWTAPTLKLMLVQLLIALDLITYLAVYFSLLQQILIYSPNLLIRTLLFALWALIFLAFKTKHSLAQCILALFRPSHQLLTLPAFYLLFNIPDLIPVANSTIFNSRLVPSHCPHFYALVFPHIFSCIHVNYAELTCLHSFRTFISNMFPQISDSKLLA